MESLQYKGDSYEQKEVETVVYTAEFVLDPDALKKKYPPVHENHYYHHSTNDFMPENGAEGIDLGLEGVLKITGRVTTDQVDVLLVDNPKSSMGNPHITLSTAEGVPPYNSNAAIEIALQEGSVTPLVDSVVVVQGYFNGQDDVTRPMSRSELLTELNDGEK